MGFKVGIKEDYQDMLLDYLTVSKKAIFPKPRKVSINPELVTRLKSHPKKAEINHIMELLIAGGNVNIFQSDKLLYTKFHDHLVYEWKIYHFHLSLKPDKKKGFVKRGDRLLFVYIDDEQAIILDDGDHSEGTFGSEKWLTILDNHFPHIIAPFYHPEILGVSPEISPVERQNLWDHGINTAFTMINGKAFFSMGMGRATSGHSIAVTDQMITVERWIRDISKQVDTRFEDICIFHNLPVDASRFHLRFGANTLELFELNSKKTIRTLPYLF